MNYASESYKDKGDPKCNHSEYSLNPLLEPVRHSHPQGKSSGDSSGGLFNMPKRLTETDKWKDSWFLDLPLDSKILFQYLCDNCDMAGFYQRHDRTISALTGIPLSDIPKCVKALSKSVIERGGIFWVVNFLEHQKNLPLKLPNNAHLSALRSLVNHAPIFSELYLGFIGFSLKELKDILAPSQGQASPYGKAKGNSKGKAKGTGDANPVKCWDYPPKIEKMVKETLENLRK